MESTKAENIIQAITLGVCIVGLAAVGISGLVEDGPKSSRHYLISDKNVVYPEALPLDVLPLLPPCPTEDSNNCYWDAQTMGNGEGTDSVVIVP